MDVYNLVQFSFHWADEETEIQRGKRLSGHKDVWHQNLNWLTLSHAHFYSAGILERSQSPYQVFMPQCSSENMLDSWCPL